MRSQKFPIWENVIQVKISLHSIRKTKAMLKETFPKFSVIYITRLGTQVKVVFTVFVVNAMEQAMTPISAHPKGLHQDPGTRIMLNDLPHQDDYMMVVLKGSSYTKILGYISNF